MRRTIAALAASRHSCPYRADLKPPAMPVVMTGRTLTANNSAMTLQAAYHRHDIPGEVWALLSPYLSGQLGQWDGIAQDANEA